MQIVTNEIDVAKKLINGTYDGKLKSHAKLVTIAKYYLHEELKDVKTVKTLLDEYLANRSEKYVWEINDGYLKSIVRKANASQLINIQPIEIYDSEVEQIRKVKHLVKEKVLFSFLVYAKVNMQIRENSKGWVGNPTKEIFDSADVNYTAQKRELLVGSLVKDGYLNLSMNNQNTSRQVNYISLTGKVFTVIDNFEQLGLQYESLFGISDVIKCERCGVLVRKSGKNTKYCNTCRKHLDVENTRKRVEKHRISKNM